MSSAIVYSRAAAGIDAPAVTIEVHLSKGLPGLAIVGLPAKAVKESKDRVRCAILNSQFEFPIKRIIVNLAPADLPKEGGRFDLPIALGILAASGQITKGSLQDYEFIGELALTGEIRPVSGILPFVMAVQATQRQLFIPAANAEEATLMKSHKIYIANHITEVCQHLNQSHLLSPFTATIESTAQKSFHYPDLNDVVGQDHAKRALQIAAAGGHSLLFVGPPGTGKTMLASRLPGLLPPLTEAEALEVAAIYSVSKQQFHPENWRRRTFRAPHHTASSIALVGGGNPPKPGEISLAHQGVLFLDELPEFNRHALEVLREPLEAGRVSISRASHQVHFPANFQLVTAMNPCPCGYFGAAKSRCHCSPDQIQRYQSRISGPLLDRIDMQLIIPTLPLASLLQQQKNIKSITSHEIRTIVSYVHQKQQQRCSKVNAKLTPAEIWQFCSLHECDRPWFEKAVTKLNLSARACHRILRLARTIADLADQAQIQEQHLQEALSYRQASIFSTTRCHY